MEKIVIIGNGRFGNLLFQTLKKSDLYEVFLCSRRKKPDGKSFLSIEEAAKCDIIIPCIPISIYEDFFKEFGPKISPGSTVIDIASIKVHTTKVILENTGELVDVLSTHPTFGPDSSKNGTSFKNLKLIYWFEQIKNMQRAEKFLKFWEELGCINIEMTPHEHDKQAAYTHAYAFLIGKIGMMLQVRKNEVSTKGFEGILYNQQAVENDSGQLFNDMMNFNPYVPKMIEEFGESLDKINKGLIRK